MSNVYTAVAGNARNGQPEFTSTWITDDYEYAVLVRHDWRAIVCQRPRNPLGEWIMHDITDTTIGLIEVSDSHQGISIGVDWRGIVHISGNTHSTRIRHIQTTQPHDITEWEEAPRIPTMSKHVVNLVENGVVENNLDGWESADNNLYTLDRAPFPYGWGSTHGNDSETWATRIVRTANSPNNVIAQGRAHSISGSGFPVTPGEKYNTHLSFRAVMSSLSEVQHQLWLVFRNGETEVSRVASEAQNAPDISLWHRPSVLSAVAPLGADNAIVEFRTTVVSGNASAGDQQRTNGLMLYQGEPVGDVLYRDGGFLNDDDASGWRWDGEPYASTSRGPLWAEGYAGIDSTTYNRFQRLSDGTLLLSASIMRQPNNPVGRTWGLWKMPPGEDNFLPTINGSDATVMKTTPHHLVQGASHPTQAARENDAASADRPYFSHVFVDREDNIHGFCWFRMVSSVALGNLMYVVSKDGGNTWQNIHGETMTMPLIYPRAHEENARVVIDGHPFAMTTMRGITVDNEGRPYCAVTESGVGQTLVYWDGSQWKKESLEIAGGQKTIGMIRDDLWVFVRRNVPSRGGGLGLWGHNYTKSGMTPLVRFGSIGVGTPDGDFQFESGAAYEPAPVHAGGLDTSGNYVFRCLVPDNDYPVIRQFGVGARGRVT